MPAGKLVAFPDGQSRHDDIIKKHMAGLTWDHTEDIALSLYDAHPEMDPTNIRYTDLHKWIVELPNFKDDPESSTEGKLEAIQMAWLEEYQDNQ